MKEAIMAKKILDNKNIWILASLFFLGLFCFIASVTSLLPFADLPFQIVSACLEAVVTAIITVFLLKAQTHEQTEAELAKERFSVLFSKKTELYDSYLDGLLEIANRGTITKEEFMKFVDDLNFKLAMFIGDESNNVIAAQLDMIGKNHDTATIKQCVFNIAQELKKDLRAIL
jgi:membrane-associated protease RseP (regulator of RpoE activity)